MPLIGLDIGTSTTKAILMSPDGGVIQSHSGEYPIDSPHPGWAEQDPEAWVTQAKNCLGVVAAGHRDAVKGLSLSGQMHGVVLLGEDQRPLRPAIIWADQRSADALEEIASRYPREVLGQTILNRPAAGFGLATLVWLRNHEPDILRKTRTVLAAKDYVRFRLTGVLGQEVSDASGTTCLDVRKGDWAFDILSGLGLPDRIFPKISGSLDPAGEINADAARDTGLRPGTPVFFGGADNGCAGIGSGLTEDGCLGINIGTGGQVGVAASEPYYDPEYRLSVFNHSIPGRFNIFGASLAAGLSLKWLRDTFFPGRPFAELSALAARAQPGAGGLLFVPYLAGERTPWFDPGARGQLFGLSLSHGAPEICRAVMEGVTYALEQSFALLVQAGVKPRRLLSLGGGAKSEIWPRIQADVFGMPLETAAAGDACTGAAILAGVGAGIYPDISAGVKAAVRPPREKFDPDPTRHAFYQGRREAFRELYLRTRDLATT
ncbi:MAG: xylulokinase [Planctomycetota bacterium]|jgi:xylulokinase|nr:xylulokinase [Planctomycetota bacterium]